MQSKLRLLLVNLASLTAVSTLSPLSAADWGYEQDELPQGLSAGPAKSLSAKAAKPINSQSCSSAPGKTASSVTVRANDSITPIAAAQRKEDRNKRLQARALPVTAASITAPNQAVADWIKLYAFVSEQELSPEQKGRLTEILQTKLKSARTREVTGILEFWPRVESASAASPQQKDNYKALLRALLRQQYARIAPENEAEKGLIGEILGPTRIAAAGSPPLTEDAIEAYADMACFLYEQNHPGKTVNAMDNRMVFAGVIRGKFMEAPSEKDKAAMAIFDLTWSKFKILWDGANEHNKQKLLAAWTHKNATTAGAMPTDPTLDAVLKNGPWSPRN